MSILSVAKLTRLGIGETWWVKLPGHTTLDSMEVMAFTRATVTLMYIDSTEDAVYARKDVEFIERVSP